MKRKIKFKSVKTLLTFWFIVTALAPLVVVSTIVYYQRVESIKTEAFNKLTAVRDLKVHQVNDWINEIFPKATEAKMLVDDVDFGITVEEHKRREQRASMVAIDGDDILRVGTWIQYGATEAGERQRGRVGALRQLDDDLPRVALPNQWSPRARRV